MANPAEVFIVPPAEDFKHGSGRTITNPNCMCACSHLAMFFGNYKGANWVDWTEVPKPLRETLGANERGYGSEAWDDLWRGNDKANTGEERRENMINWLRKYFPECEVK